MRRLALLVLGLMIAGGLTAWALLGALTPTKAVQAIMGEGETSIEQWVGRQLEAIADDLLQPEFRFTGFDYEYPGTVTLRDASLTDAGQVFIEVESLQIELAEIPQVGEPLIIESVIANHPTVRLLVQSDGSLLGFSNMVAQDSHTAHDDGAATAPSDVFAIRHLAFNRGVIEYAPQDGPPMRLDDITMAFDGAPADGGAPGVYGIDAHLDRAPMASLHIAGDLDIDNGSITLSTGALNTQLDDDVIQILPPVVQEFVAAHSMRGMLELKATGFISLVDAAMSTLEYTIVGRDTTITFDACRIELDSVDIAGRYGPDALTAEFTIHGADGVVTGDAQGAPHGAFAAGMSVQFQDVQLERLFPPAEGEPAKYVGRIDAEGDFTADIADFAATIQGAGRATMEEGYLVDDPVMATLASAIGGEPSDPNDRSHEGETQFTIVPGEIRFTDVDVRSTTMAARGEGEITFAGMCDFRFNAGPLEKVQGLLGEFGKVLGHITDAIVTYRISGPLQAPEFEVQPLGIGSD